MTEQIAEILKNDLGVKENYQHAPKRVTGKTCKLGSRLTPNSETFRELEFSRAGHLTFHTLRTRKKTQSI
jgi:hypothetical protein